MSGSALQAILARNLTTRLLTYFLLPTHMAVASMLQGDCLLR